MIKSILILVSFVLGTSAFAADDKKAMQADVVIREGKIVKMVPSKTEIYIEENGKKYEYYFKQHTQVTQNGTPSEYSALKEGMKVRVTADRVGKRLDPKLVEILN